MSRPLRYLDDVQTRETERAAFIAAAFELLADREYLQLSIAEVVERSGRHRAAFYRLFGSKDGLILAMAEDGVAQTVKRLDRAMREAPDDEHAVRVWARTLLALAIPRAATHGVPALSLDRFHLLRAFPNAEDRLTRPLISLIEPYISTDADPSPHVLADVAYQAVMGRQSSWIATVHRPTRREIDEYVDCIVQLLGANPGQARCTDG